MDNEKTIVNDENNELTHGFIEAGTVLGEYRVTRPLGHGAMGEVYEAEQVRLGRHYALKVLPLELSQDVSFQRRFESEARLLAQLEHPNIVGIHYAGDAPYRGGKISYLVMERLYPLSDWFSEQTQVGVEEVASILMQVLEALIYAHGLGLIHRDLKPANLLMTQEGEIKVGDFGVAQVVGEQYMRTLVERTVAQSRLGDASTVVSRSSAGSDYAGTLHYMAPEVIGGFGATARSDLYAVGVMAYEWLTGRKPIGRYKDVSVLNPGLGKAWDDWVNRLLEPEPDERFASAEDAAVALGQIALRSDTAQPNAGESKGIPPPFTEKTGEKSTIGSNEPTTASPAISSPPPFLKPVAASPAAVDELTPEESAARADFLEKHDGCRISIGLALWITVLFPGLGHVLFGRPKEGMLWFIGVIVGSFIFPFGVNVGALIHLSVTRDAERIDLRSPGYRDIFKSEGWFFGWRVLLRIGLFLFGLSLLIMIMVQPELWFVLIIIFGLILAFLWWSYRRVFRFERLIVEESKRSTPLINVGAMQFDNRGGSVKVTKDDVIRSGAIISGHVTFSDGHGAGWQIDQAGRLAIFPAKHGYQPSQEDIQSFQAELQNLLERSIS